MFSTGGTVNITGISSERVIPKALKYFCKIFNVKKSYISDITIDNISASGSFNRYVDLSFLKWFVNSQDANQINRNPISSVSFNANYFPAAFCKTFTIGTVVVFGSGKFNIVGAKCAQHVNQLFEAMSVNMRKLWTMTGKEAASVLSAGL